MKILLWVLQVGSALMYGASGVMKVFMFDRISGQVTSLGALPRVARRTLGISNSSAPSGLSFLQSFAGT